DPVVGPRGGRQQAAGSEQQAAKLHRRASLGNLVVRRLGAPYLMPLRLRAAGRTPRRRSGPGGATMKQLVVAALMLMLAGFVGSAGAQEKKPATDAKANPTGTWKWKVNFGGQESERVLKLKLDGDKLTGTISGGP